MQNSGMGVPSISIYAHELITVYGAKTLVRVGTCGALQPGMKLRDLVLAQSASTDSSLIANRFRGMAYAPTADFDDARAPKYGRGKRSTMEPMNTIRPLARRTNGIITWVMVATV